jgi:hypothetical protein
LKPFGTIYRICLLRTLQLIAYRSRIRHRPKGLSRPEFISDSAWRKLEHIHGALEHFYDVTILTEGDTDTLIEYVQLLDHLLNEIGDVERELEDIFQQEQTTDNLNLRNAAHEAWLALERYMNHCDESAADYAAL